MSAPRAAHYVPRPVARWWSAKTGGERRVIATLAVLAGVGLGWWAVWQPLARDIDAMRAAAARDATALHSANRMADEIAGLARSVAPQPAADAHADLERVLAQQALRSALTQQDWHDGRAHLVFARVDYDALIGALETLQRDARLRVVEATLTARVDPGTVRADVVLAR